MTRDDLRHVLLFTAAILLVPAVGAAVLYTFGRLLGWLLGPAAP